MFSTPDLRPTRTVIAVISAAAVVLLCFAATFALAQTKVQILSTKSLSNGAGPVRGLAASSDGTKLVVGTDTVKMQVYALGTTSIGSLLREVSLPSDTSTSTNNVNAVAAGTTRAMGFSYHRKEPYFVDLTAPYSTYAGWSYTPPTYIQDSARWWVACASIPSSTSPWPNDLAVFGQFVVGGYAYVILVDMVRREVKSMIRSSAYLMHNADYHAPSKTVFISSWHDTSNYRTLITKVQILLGAWQTGYDSGWVMRSQLFMPTSSIKGFSVVTPPIGNFGYVAVGCSMATTGCKTGLVRFRLDFSSSPSSTTDYFHSAHSQFLAAVAKPDGTEVVAANQGNPCALLNINTPGAGAMTSIGVTEATGSHYAHHVARCINHPTSSTRMVCTYYGSDNMQVLDWSGGGAADGGGVFTSTSTTTTTTTTSTTTTTTSTTTTTPYQKLAIQQTANIGSGDTSYGMATTADKMIIGTFNKKVEFHRWTDLALVQTVTVSDVPSAIAVCGNKALVVHSAKTTTLFDFINTDTFARSGFASTPSYSTTTGWHAAVGITGFAQANMALVARFASSCSFVLVDLDARTDKATRSYGEYCHAAAYHEGTKTAFFGGRDSDTTTARGKIFKLVVNWYTGFNNNALASAATMLTPAGANLIYTIAVAGDYVWVGTGCAPTYTGCVSGIVRVRRSFSSNPDSNTDYMKTSTGMWYASAAKNDESEIIFASREWTPSGTNGVKFLNIRTTDFTSLGQVSATSPYWPLGGVTQPRPSSGDAAFVFASPDQIVKVSFGGGGPVAAAEGLFTSTTTTLEPTGTTPSPGGPSSSTTGGGDAAVDTAVIAGASVGGVVVILVIVLILIFACRSSDTTTNQQQQQHSEGHDDNIPPNTKEQQQQQQPYTGTDNPAAGFYGHANPNAAPSPFVFAGTEMAPVGSSSAPPAAYPQQQQPHPASPTHPPPAVPPNAVHSPGAVLPPPPDVPPGSVSAFNGPPPAWKPEELGLKTADNWQLAPQVGPGMYYSANLRMHYSSVFRRYAFIDGEGAVKWTLADGSWSAPIPAADKKASSLHFGLSSSQ